jgi:hypothetical protein
VEIVVAETLALITPALFSQPPPIRREKREKFVGVCLKSAALKPFLSRRSGGRLGERGLGE